MTIRILLADDQDLVRAGFQLILQSQPDFTVVAQAADGEQAVALAAQHEPDVVLMDIRMPRLDGIAATQRVVAANPRTKVLVLTTFDLDGYVYDALVAGASGFLLKDVSRADLVAAVRVLAAGEALLAPSITRRLLSDFVRARPLSADISALESLTARETDALLLLARGLSNADIAAAMFVSEHTVKTHVGNVFMKLGLRDRIHAVIWAYEHGIVAPGASG